MAKDTYYFPHDYNARTDPKLVKVMSKLGMQGIGVYWCLVEMLYEQGGQLKVSDVDTYAYALRTDIKVIKEILTKYELFTLTGEFYVSPSAVRRLDHRNDIREKNSKNAKKRWEKANGIQPQSDGNATALQPESRKGKERKGNKKKEEDIYIIPDSVKNELQQIVDKWNIFAVTKKLSIWTKTHDERNYNLYERYKEKEFDFDKILDEIKKSDFLLGKTKECFRVSLDWIVKNNINYIKILEGNYKNERTYRPEQTGKKGFTGSNKEKFAKLRADLDIRGASNSA